jgi:cytochrome c oxidase cbb3-type subunit I/II
MFSGSSAKPNHDALAVVAYLRSLGRERELAGDTGSEQVDHGMAMEMSSGYSAHGILDTVPRIDLGGINPDAPVFATTGNFEAANQERGRGVFQHNCSGCHGVNADDNGTPRPGLLQIPADLHKNHYSDAHLGRYSGTESMVPPCRRGDSWIRQTWQP